MRLVAITAVAVLLAGCASNQPQMTRDEYLATAQRVYRDKTPDDVFHAAEKLFQLADGNDFQFHYTDDTMTASRRWSVYLVLAAAMGTDVWYVHTKPDGQGTKVSALVSTTSGAVAPMATTGGDWTAGSVPSGGSIVPGTAIYDVFWARMDYLLGKSDRWMTCKDADERLKSKAVWGTNEALCNSFNVKDQLPEELRQKSGA